MSGAFTDRLARRLARGAAEYGGASLSRPLTELLDEVEEEALDVVGWAAVMDAVAGGSRRVDRGYVDHAVVQAQRDPQDILDEAEALEGPLRVRAVILALGVTGHRAWQVVERARELLGDGTTYGGDDEHG
ncbi:MAG: hypothetical protein KC543_02490 [Myxococcales bacterium]|nr:hypothetical protein [Myxococcales bacterium]